VASGERGAGHPVAAARAPRQGHRRRAAPRQGRCPAALRGSSLDPTSCLRTPVSGAAALRFLPRKSRPLKDDLESLDGDLCHLQPSQHIHWTYASLNAIQIAGRRSCGSACRSPARSSCGQLRPLHWWARQRACCQAQAGGLRQCRHLVVLHPWANEGAVRGAAGGRPCGRRVRACVVTALPIGEAGPATAIAIAAAAPQQGSLGLLSRVF
jgi:hypothetical protein